MFNRWQRKAINYFIAVMRSWSAEERQAVFVELYEKFGDELIFAVAGGNVLDDSHRVGRTGT